MVSFDEFKKINMQIGKILTAEDVTDTDKLYKLEVDVGKKITLVAGIKQHYTKEELVGKSIVVVTNLDPATIKGIKSEGMLLASEEDGKVILLTTDKEATPGSKIH